MPRQFKDRQEYERLKDEATEMSVAMVKKGRWKLGKQGGE